MESLWIIIQGEVIQLWCTTYPQQTQGKQEALYRKKQHNNLLIIKEKIKLSPNWLVLNNSNNKIFIYLINN